MADIAPVSGIVSHWHLHRGRRTARRHQCGTATQLSTSSAHIGSLPLGLRPRSMRISDPRKLRRRIPVGRLILDCPDELNRAGVSPPKRTSKTWCAPSCALRPVFESGAMGSNPSLSMIGSSSRHSFPRHGAWCTLTPSDEIAAALGIFSSSSALSRHQGRALLTIANKRADTSGAAPRTPTPLDEGLSSPARQNRHLPSNEVHICARWELDSLKVH
ncbi:hypothetical protein C8R46DRAFT_1184299 [Mycena filopes]|nr:hypothetical protein C8R46DRAFT_1184299 [Mycena filopes]